VNLVLAGPFIEHGCSLAPRSPADHPSPLITAWDHCGMPTKGSHSRAPASHSRGGAPDSISRGGILASQTYVKD
jgi:hypothetical protein